MIDSSAIANAVALVAEQSFFAWAEPAVADAVMLPEGRWWSASVSFDGPVAGRMTFTVPDHLARHLFASFLGLEPEEAIDDTALRDCLGEFANMCCGAWLTSLRQHRSFALQHPQVAPLDGDPAGGATAIVLVNDEPVIVHASVE